MNSTKEIRVAWIYPAIPFGAYWQPVINEFTKFFENTSFYTGCPWKGFNPMDPQNAAFKVIGKAKNLVLAKNVQGYDRTFIMASPAIVQPLLQTKPHIIYASAFSIWTVLALLLKPIGQWQIVIIYDGSSPNSDFQDSYLRTTIRRLMVRAADAFVANSQAAKRYLVEVLNAPEQKVYSATYLVPHAETLMQLVQGDKETQISLKNPTFLFVGQLIHRKGINTLLEACSILQQSGYENYSVLIVGDGENREELVEFARKNKLDKQITWAGWVEYGKLGFYFQQADVFVFPTFEDVWGMAALEAMVFGKPVLCSKGANASELVSCGVNGYVFDSQDPTELASRMRQLIDQPELLTEMGQQSRKLIAQHTPTTVAKKLYEITLSVLSN